MTFLFYSLNSICSIENACIFRQECYSSVIINVFSAIIRHQGNVNNVARTDSRKPVCKTGCNIKVIFLFCLYYSHFFYCFKIAFINCITYNLSSAPGGDSRQSSVFAGLITETLYPSLSIRHPKKADWAMKAPTNVSHCLAQNCRKCRAPARCLCQTVSDIECE